MTNKAYKWLSEWVEKGGLWRNVTYAGVWSLYLGSARSNSNDFNVEIFRDELRQLLADADAGRKLRKTTKSYSNIFGVCSEGDETDEEMLANLNRLDGK
jgi:hypothetical protein